MTKDKNTHTSRKKDFLKLPRYSGGKKAFLEFVTTNLEYPEKALKDGIEGTVHAEYEVDNLGRISAIKVIKGIGYGCDEEAIRILSLMKYEAVHNRGLRVKSKLKARIQFKLPIPTAKNTEMNVNINYTITPKEEKEKRVNTSYSYTVNL